MSNTYRMIHSEPDVVVIEMATASGWIPVERTHNKDLAITAIKKRKLKEDWVVKQYDEDGNLVA